jgi:DNA-binding NtrC family response regulator
MLNRHAKFDHVFWSSLSCETSMRVASDLAAGHSSPLRLVGREAEMLVLRGCFAQMLAGHGSLVLVSGEAGIGKT